MALSAADLAAAMDTAFTAQWNTVKNQNLASFGQAERMILFVGIARGILTYLEANQDQIFTSVTLTVGSGIDRSYPITAMDFNG